MERRRHELLARLEAAGITGARRERLRRSRLYLPGNQPKLFVNAGLHGPDGLIYPGTCRTKPKPDQMPDGETLRLDMTKAVATISTETLTFTEIGPVHTGTHIVDLSKAHQTLGDIVFARRDMGTSYHLSVVIDDSDQGITHVTRGADLFDATQIHVILQALLNHPIPTYHHHDLIRDDRGKRLAKRDDARAIALYRAEGKTPKDVADLIGTPLLSPL